MMLTVPALICSFMAHSRAFITSSVPLPDTFLCCIQKTKHHCALESLLTHSQFDQNQRKGKFVCMFFQGSSVIPIHNIRDFGISLDFQINCWKGQGRAPVISWASEWGQKLVPCSLDWALPLATLHRVTEETLGNQ